MLYAWTTLFFLVAVTSAQVVNPTPPPPSTLQCNVSTTSIAKKSAPLFPSSVLKAIAMACPSASWAGPTDATWAKSSGSATPYYKMRDQLAPWASAYALGVAKAQLACTNTGDVIQCQSAMVVATAVANVQAASLADATFKAFRTCSACLLTPADKDALTNGLRITLGASVSTSVSAQVCVGPGATGSADAFAKCYGESLARGVAKIIAAFAINGGCSTADLVSSIRASMLTDVDTFCSCDSRTSTSTDGAAGAFATADATGNCTAFADIQPTPPSPPSPPPPPAGPYCPNPGASTAISKGFSSARPQNNLIDFILSLLFSSPCSRSGSLWIAFHANLASNLPSTTIPGTVVCFESTITGISPAPPSTTVCLTLDGSSTPKTGNPYSGIKVSISKAKGTLIGLVLYRCPNGVCPMATPTWTITSSVSRGYVDLSGASWQFSGAPYQVDQVDVRSTLLYGSACNGYPTSQTKCQVPGIYAGRSDACGAWSAAKPLCVGPP